MIIEEERAPEVGAAVADRPEPHERCLGPRPLPLGALYRRCPPGDLPFTTTAEVPDLDEIVGQRRAVDAIDLAVTAAGPGYNLFALGPTGIGKATAIRHCLAEHAREAPTPDDWCYVHDFADPQRPRALRVPAGMGVQLSEAMVQLALELRGAIPAAFESDAYRRQKETIEGEFQTRQEEALSQVGEHAQAVGIALVRTPVGFGFAPSRNGEVIASEDFRRLPEADQDRYRAEIARLEDELHAVLRQVPQWQRETRRRMRELDRETISTAVDHLIDELRRRFSELPAVVDYLDGVERDVVERAQEFLSAAQADGNVEESAPVASDGGPFRRYRVNVLVQHEPGAGAPIVAEDHPTYANLTGRTEYVAQLGTLMTDFTLIRPGALHRANGGYLVLEADKVLLEPYAWEQLKRALRTRELRVEPLAGSLGLLTTATLEPEPIPLQVKVALLGDRRLYYLLCEFDREFLELFKVAADFSDEVDWTTENAVLYGRLMATLARRESLRPFSAGAVARAIESLAREAEDARKLSARIGRLSDLMHEADQIAGRHGRPIVGALDVQRAIDARIERSSRYAERLQEAIERATIAIAVDGEAIGQVNALSVVQLGDERFGHPSRVTATARVGKGEVVDIEREVELGGPIHSKGVLILSGLLARRFGHDPLTLHASLVFEQSYGGVEGDSASLAELCALLSAIGDLPVRQDLAMTGSVDQHGGVQAVGGVNEKIEGFFDTCAARGLTGTQGVIIPAANMEHLMLASRVRRAARAGQFHVFAASTVDEALEILTSMPAGSADAAGDYPADTANGRVQAGLRRYAEIARRMGAVGPAAGPGPSLGSETAVAG